jgi:flavin reductase (DIM6/NTAB) family NADH-FMN oxidoreductase RutF
MMLEIDPKTTPTKDFHQFMLGAVAPRPIAWASTMGADGSVNLAPYSFFNAFSSNPPILIFSSNRRVANNTTKDTLRNIEETMEVVINVVPYELVQQMTVSSIEFEYGVNEFEKAGVTPLKSLKIKPLRIAESPIQMECKVTEIIKLGTEGGAGNLFVCEVVLMHISEKVLDTNNRIDPDKLDLMGRMGRAFYVRSSGDAVKTIVQGQTSGGVGFDNLPNFIKNSNVFTGNNLGQLAGLPTLPTTAEVLLILEKEPALKQILEFDDPKLVFQQMAKEALDNGNLEYGAKLAMLSAI